MEKIISGGIVLFLVFSVFASIGEVSEASVFSVGDAFTVLGAMVGWSLITLFVYEDFIS